MTNNSAIINSVTVLLLIKLSLSPWASGESAIQFATFLNYLADISILSIGICLIAETPKKFSFVYVTLTFSAAILLLSGLVNGTSIVDAWKYLLRMYSPIIYMLILIKVSISDFGLVKLAAGKLLVFSLLLIIIGLVLLPDSYNRFEYWWPSYFGGVHTTAYSAISIFYISFALLYVRAIKFQLVLILMLLVMYSVTFGWGVRTALLGFCLFILLTLNGKLNIARRVLIPVLLFLFTVFVPYILYVVAGSDEIDKLSSGRISMYKAKIDQLMDNTVFQWLFGSGYGSDLIETDFWQAEKGAHNDYLTFIVEGGVLFCFVVMYMLFKLYSVIPNKIGKYMIISFCITSLFSNGMIVRPIPSYLFFTGLAILFFKNAHDDRGLNIAK